MFEIDLLAFSTVSKHHRTGNWNPSQLTRFVLSCMIKTWVLMAWLELEPGHHQQWYTPGYPGIFHFSAPEGLNKWSLMELRHYLNLCRLIVSWTLGRNFDCWHRRNIFFRPYPGNTAQASEWVIYLNVQYKSFQIDALNIDYNFFACESFSLVRSYLHMWFCHHGVRS